MNDLQEISNAIFELRARVALLEREIIGTAEAPGLRDRMRALVAMRPFLIWSVIVLGALEIFNLILAGAILLHLIRG
jgi:hypothetical protein